MGILENNYTHVYLIKRKMNTYKHKCVGNISRINDKQECVNYLLNRGHP